jgi:hypothetical protein
MYYNLIKGAKIMKANDVFAHLMEFNHMLVRTYVDDLSDADLLVRSVPGTNHIAWQLGHIISGSKMMLQSIGQPAPELPAGFDAKHTRETASIDDPAKFCKKDEYLSLLDGMKAASLAAFAAIPESDLDKPGPEQMRQYAPTVGSVLMMISNHWMMHIGQFIPIRRKLGKPAKF